MAIERTAHSSMQLVIRPKRTTFTSALASETVPEKTARDAEAAQQQQDLEDVEASLQLYPEDEEGDIASARSFRAGSAISQGPIKSRYDTEKDHCTSRICNAWNEGIAASVEEIVGEEFFGKKAIARKVYQALAALADRTLGNIAYGSMLLRHALLQRNRVGCALNTKDTYAGHDILDGEEARAEREEGEEAEKERQATKYQEMTEKMKKLKLRKKKRAARS